MKLFLLNLIEIHFHTAFHLVAYIKQLISGLL